MDELAEHQVTKVEWRMADKVSCFLFTATAVTDQQCGQTYVTLSVSLILYSKFRKHYERFISDGDGVIEPIASNILKKLFEYLLEMAMDQTTFARILDPRFPNDILHDSDILRRYVVLSLNEVEAVEHRLEKRMQTPLEQLLDERSMDGPLEHEVVGFPCTTENWDSSFEPVEWWQNKETCFPQIAAATKMCWRYRAHLWQAKTAIPGRII